MIASFSVIFLADLWTFVSMNSRETTLCFDSVRQSSERVKQKIKLEITTV